MIGIFNDDAFRLIAKSPIEKIIVTNTAPIRTHDEIATKKIVRLTVGSKLLHTQTHDLAPLIAETIRRIAEHESISDLFNLQ